MNMSTYISSYLRYSNLDERAIKAISGALLNQLYLDKPIPSDKFAEIVYDKDIPVGKLPQEKIVKMAKREHVEKFFDDGTLQLGNFKYFNNFDHNEIGDRSEGGFVLVGRHEREFAFTQIGGGFHYHAFCTYAGDADPDCIKRFGYDSYFTILDVQGFSSAIAETLSSKRNYFSSCVYKKDKVVVGDVGPDFDFNRMSADLLDLASEAKYFVKPKTYSHQREFRFIWSSSKDLTSPLLIKCPEAIKYCSKQ